MARDHDPTRAPVPSRLPMLNRRVVLVLAICIPVGIVIAACIGIGYSISRAPFMSPTFASEVDGVRPLSGGFELAMLKSFPRLIIEKSSPVGRAQIIVPPDSAGEGAEQVGRYFEWPPFIAGHVEPFVSSTRRRGPPPDPARKFFMVNVETRRVDYFAAKEEWEAACKGQGVNLEQVKWRVPDPGM